MKAFLVALFCLSAFIVNAQKLKSSDVPGVVTAAFGKKFPNVKNVEWEKEGVLFEGEFTEDGKEKSAVYDGMGGFIELETEIPVAELPQAVKDRLAKDFADHKVNEAAMIEKGGKVLYEAEVKKGLKSVDVLFDDKGTVVDKIAKD